MPDAEPWLDLIDSAWLRRGFAADAGEVDNMSALSQRHENAAVLGSSSMISKPRMSV